MALIRHIPFGDSFANTTVTGPIGGNGALFGGDNTSAHRVAGPGPSVPHAFDFNGVDDYVFFNSGSTFGTQATARRGRSLTACPTLDQSAVRTN